MYGFRCTTGPPPIRRPARPLLETWKHWLAGSLRMRLCSPSSCDCSAGACGRIHAERRGGGRVISTAWWHILVKCIRLRPRPLAAPSPLLRAPAPALPPLSPSSPSRLTSGRLPASILRCLTCLLVAIFCIARFAINGQFVTRSAYWKPRAATRNQRRRPWEKSYRASLDIPSSAPISVSALRALQP